MMNDVLVKTFRPLLTFLSVMSVTTVTECPDGQGTAVNEFLCSANFPE